jgi:hypothetical protein
MNNKMTFRVFNSEEQGGLRPKGAPPIVSKRQKNKRKHKVLFIGWQVTGVRSNALPAFERTSYLWSNARRAFDRK